MFNALHSSRQRICTLPKAGWLLVKGGEIISRVGINVLLIETNRQYNQLLTIMLATPATWKD